MLTNADRADLERGLDAIMAAGLPSPFAQTFPSRKRKRNPSRTVHACTDRVTATGGPYFTHGPRETCNYCNPGDLTAA